MSRLLWLGEIWRLRFWFLGSNVFHLRVSGDISCGVERAFFASMMRFPIASFSRCTIKIFGSLFRAWKLLSQPAGIMKP